ncbi:putative Phosphatidylinositol Nacetylglucosaminyltransferase subunit c [Balamuthia mandrillaris]
MSMAATLAEGTVGSAATRRRRSRSASRPPWRKILWVEQPYEANYVDPNTFLRGLIRNANQREYDIVELIKDSTTVTQHMNFTLLFILLFIATWHEWLSSTSLFVIEAALTVLCYLFRFYIDPTFRVSSFLSSLKSMALVTFTLVALSPVLHTLVDSVSNDTIWALAILFTVLHVFLHDYGYTHASTDRMEAPVSLNAAIFLSVLMASRLSTSTHVFALLIAAVQIFAISPIIRHHIKRYAFWLHVSLTVITFILAAGFLLQVSKAAGIAYVLFILFVSFVCPLWLKYIQRFKDEINGPWDEAMPPAVGQED